MKIVVVGICGALNSGDHTQLNSLLAVLQDAFPSARVACIHRNPDLHAGIFPQCDWMEQIGTCHTFNMSKRRAINVYRLLAALAGVSKALPVCQQNTYQALRDADLVVACPGGYLEDSSPAILTNLAHLLIPKSDHCTWFVAPQSIGPFHHRIMMHYTAKFLGRASAICIREPCSLAYVTEQMHLPAERVHLYPDMAFFDRTTDEIVAAQVLHSLGIKDDEPLAGMTLWPVGQRGGSESDYFRCLSDVADRVYATYGLRTVILRQVGDADGVKGDGELLKRAAAVFGRGGVFSYDYHTPEVLRAIIARCTVFYGTRMHGNIFALGQRIPTVAISYHPKTEGIMRMCGQDEYVVRLADLEAARLSDLIALAIKNSGEICEQLAHVLRGFDAKRAELIALLRACYSAS